MKLAGQIAFLKMYLTQNAQETANDAVQLFGGRGITRTGMGRFIEHVRLRCLPWFVCVLMGRCVVSSDGDV